MRETKYKAWIKDGQFMVDVLSLSLVSGGISHSRLRESYMPIKFEKDNYELMQYTGLTDKHGKEIYENYVIEAWSQGVKAVGKVQQRIDGLWVIYPAWQKEKTWGLMPDKDGSTSVEIIGNIYENPELLRGDE